MHSHVSEKNPEKKKELVLILVVMEDALALLFITLDEEVDGQS